MTIAILYSLPTRRAKHTTFLKADEDTVVSASVVARALSEKGATPLLIGLSEDTIVKTIQSIRADLIINLIDWTGADLPLSLVAMDALTACGIPFAGATKENFQLVDKVVMKKALDRFVLPTARWQVFHTGNEPILETLTYPVIVKLAAEHCSIGLEKTSLVQSKDDLRAVVQDRIKRFSQDVYAEEFISGREFQITVLEQKQGLVMLPPAEIMYKPSESAEFLTFTERWNEEDPLYARSNTVLAVLTEEQHILFESIALRTFTDLKFRDFTRIDARMRGANELLILEANPNPGLDDDEFYSMTISAKAVGLTFPDFLWEIVESVLRRQKISS